MRCFRSAVRRLAPIQAYLRTPTLSGWGSSEHTVIAGTRVHAAVLGSVHAPVVVCVHGLGCSHRYFRPLAMVLASDARVVAPDLPGFGRTPGPWPPLDVRGLSLALADWLNATDRGGAVLVANSFGGQLLVDLAVHSPQLLGPVVLVGPTVDPRARSATRQLGRLTLNARWERPSLWPVLALDYLSCGPRRYASTLGHMLADRVEHKLPYLGAPTVVVRGACDRIAPRPWAHDVVRSLPEGRLVEVPRAGHTLNWSAPHALGDIVRPLLAAP